MNQCIKITLVLCCCAALVTAQYDFGFDYNDGYLGTSFGGNSQNQLRGFASRDPRGDTGPVLFPPSPAGNPADTSGVVVGASGYGFVPPGSQGPASPRYFYRGFYLRR